MTCSWAVLDTPWQSCLEEAWSAYTLGSIPIGAAITDQHGHVVARGRNRIFEASAPVGLLCGQRMAHAEMNALLALAWQDLEPATLVLYSTTEPCALCVGALRMTRIGEVRYAARDSAAGSIALLDATPFMRRGGLRVVGPSDPSLEALIVALHVEFSLRTGHYDRSSWVLATWQETVPRGVALGFDLLQSGLLQRWCREHVSMAEVVQRLALREAASESNDTRR